MAGLIIKIEHSCSLFKNLGIARMFFTYINKNIYFSIRESTMFWSSLYKNDRYVSSEYILVY